jgi:transcription antitermination factor NusA-like protein
MVRTALDSFCVKSGILCRKCEEKVRSGEVTKLDLKVIKALMELEKSFPKLQEVTYRKSAEAGGMVVVMVDGPDVATLLSQGGKIVRALEDELGRKVKVISYGGDTRQFLEELLSPLSILAINTVWIPDGSTETKAVIRGRRPRKMPVNLDIVKKLAKELRGLTLRIDFERE